MLTDLAKQDLKSLRLCGFNPTDEEVIELNDLAIRIERGKETTPINHPRIGFAGSVVLHEPTIGALIWYNEFGLPAVYTSDLKMYVYFFMMCYSRDLDYLNRFTSTSEIQKEVKKWKRKIDCTEAELWRALLWVKYGDVEFKTEPVTKFDVDENLDVLWKILIRASSYTGLTIEDLKTKTKSIIDSVTFEFAERAKIPIKQSIVDLYLDYKMVLKKIEDRCKRDLKNGGQPKYKR